MATIVPLTLADAAKLSTDDLQRGVLETFVQESSVLDRIPFLTIQGNAYAYNQEATMPSVGFRDVNEAYDSNVGTVVQKSEKLVILGGDADVDRFIVQTRGNLNDQRAIQTRMKVKAASYFYQDKFINGDTAVDTKGFDGLKKRLTGSQVIAADTNGLAIVGADDAARQKFFDKMDELVAAVPGINGSNGAFYANSLVIAKIRSAARRIGGVEMCSSIYAVKFGSAEGDQAVTGLTNGGVQVRDLGELDTLPVFRTRLEFYTGLATFGGQAAARLTGVLAS
jgi:hypothetical protein